MTDASPAKIANELNRGQQSTIRGLDENYCLLGCGEPFAFRMSKATTRRPALTKWIKADDGYKHFALTDVGVLVKAEL
jgi:hypothetical protein